MPENIKLIRELLMALSEIGSVGQIDGYAVIRQESVLDLVRRRWRGHGDVCSMPPADWWPDPSPAEIDEGRKLSAHLAALQQSNSAEGDERLHFIDGLGWVVKCNEAVRWVAEIQQLAGELRATDEGKSKEENNGRTAPRLGASATKGVIPAMTKGAGSTPATSTNAEQPARDGVAVDKIELADKIADDLIKLAPRTYDNPTMLRRDLRMLIGGYAQLYTQPPQQADGGAVATVPNSSDRTVYLDKALPAGTKLYAAQPPKSPGIGGDEAMVDRACIAWMEDSIDEWESLSNISRNTIRAGMSRALLAALGGEK